MISLTELMDQSYFPRKGSTKTAVQKNIDEMKASLKGLRSDETHIKEFLRNSNNKAILDDFGIRIDSSGKITKGDLPERLTGAWSTRDFSFSPPRKASKISLVQDRRIIGEIDEIGRIKALNEGLNPDSLYRKIDSSLLGDNKNLKGGAKPDEISPSNMEKKTYIQVDRSKPLPDGTKRVKMEDKYLYLIELKKMTLKEFVQVVMVGSLEKIFQILFAVK